MRLHRIVSAVVVLSLLASQQSLAAIGIGERLQKPADRTERERQRNADKAARDAENRAREYQDTMKEVQPEIDEFAATLLDARYPDAFLQDYVNELGQSLVPKETPAGTLFSFRVLHDPEPNAFALPDGRIYVNTGLLLFAQNEAQLAVILGHEIAHVIEQHYVESVRQQKREALLGAVFGAAAGAVLPTLFGGGKKAAAEGAVIGLTAGLVVAKVRMNAYNRQQEDEADQIGVRLALDRRFDGREGVAFFKKLTESYGDQGRFSNALYGKHSRNKDRMAYIEQLLTGQLASHYNQLRADGELTQGTGQMHMYASRMIRDVCIELMEEYDQYAVAKEHLERIADYRASDPKTLWALGRVLKLVGRSDEDRARALDFLQRAAALDQRNMYPFVHRELGLMQARLGQTPAAIDSLKKYVLNYVTKHYEYPRDLEGMYDYLLAFGDRNWTAPAVDPLVIRASTPANPAAAAPTSQKADDAVSPARTPAKPPVPSRRPTVTKPVPKPRGDR